MPGRLISADLSALLIIDMQDKLVPALKGADGLVRSLRLLARASRMLGVPTVLTEHCPAQIGHTVAALQADAAHAVTIEKHHFSAANEPAFAPAIQAWQHRLILVCGAEAHVCVAQTALGLIDAGHRVGVVADAVGSRHADDRTIALERLVQAGVAPFSVEMLLTEWMADAQHPAFKPLLGEIKARHAARGDD